MAEPPVADASDDTPAAESESAESAGTEVGATPSDYCLGRFLAPLRGLAASSATKLAAKDWLDEVSQTARALRAALRSSGEPRTDAVVETLIASVPDPIESGLVHQFETSVQALRTGIEHSLPTLPGPYFRDRGFLPWNDVEVPNAMRSDSEACRSTLPGVLLFRNSDPASARVFALLLVGETPTIGLRRTVMLNALRIARRLEVATESDVARTVRVLGPVYSGSAYSLRLALRSFADEVRATSRQERLRFQLISGTANGVSVPMLLRDPPDGQMFTPNSRLSFSSTIAPEADIECAYLWFLHKRLGARVYGQVAGSVGGTMPEVAMLSELGTEFGANPNATPLPGCPLRAGLALSFPIHVSNLRDAYESLYKRGSDGAAAAIARATALEAPLTDSRVAQDVEANPSDKTRAALDVMLSALLGEISRRGIRHVGIHATDVGDSIFLARRIRDVAPDVRLAFFDSDDLMFHPEFRSVLIGSLVVSPYPFLGVNDLDIQRPAHGSVRGFPNALAEGTFNAVLAQRGGQEEDLLEYAFNDAILPAWISTIARTGLEPTEVRPVRDSANVIYRPNAKLSLAARERALDDPAWYEQLRRTSLRIDPALPLPRLWTFLMVALVLGFFIDQTRQTHKAERFSKEAMPKTRQGSDDRAADRAIARTKWWLYASIRTFLFVLALGYLGAIYLLSLIARDTFARIATGFRSSDAFHGLSCLLILGVIALAIQRWTQTLRQFRHDYERFARYVGERLLPHSWSDLKAGIVSGRISLHDTPQVVAPGPEVSSMRPPAARWSLSLGLAPPVTRDEAARISFAQLRNIALLAGALACWFSVCLIGAALSAADWSYSHGSSAVPMLTLSVLRSVPLLNGISPAAPVLLCIACVYRWVVGRMARIALAHSISRISPIDGESDLVSTPIRLVLYPNHSAGSPSDDGYTRCERDLLNAIWRPITGRNYVAALFAVMFLPVLLVVLKPLSTLEAGWGTALLASGLALSMMLIGVTLIQQLQYWICLERLLKRTMTHRLGPVFHDVPSFVQDSVDEQLSRSSNVLLRWAACARLFAELAANFKLLRHPRLTEKQDDWSELRAEELLKLRATALVAADAPDPPQRDQAADAEEMQLCEAIIRNAARTTQLLELAWTTAQPTAAQAQWLMGRAAANDSSAQQILLPQAAASGAARGVTASAAAVPAVVIAPGAFELKPIERSSGSAPESPAKLAYGVGDDAIAVVEHCFESAEVQWLRRAQIFVATVVTLLIHRHVRQFRYFASTLTVCSLLLLSALTSYPFEPFRLLLTWIWIVVGTVAAAGLWIYVQLHRNTLISLISGTSPNHVTIDGAFMLRLFAWAGLPLLSVAAAQYPDLANFLFKMVAPFARALH